MKKIHNYLILVLVLFLIAGTSCGCAAADETYENVTTEDTGAYAGIIAQLEVISSSLNATADSMTIGSPASVSVDLTTISGSLAAIQDRLRMTPLASSDVQDISRVTAALDTAASSLLLPDPDLTAVTADTAAAETDLSAIEENLASTLSWAKNDPESYGNDVIIIEESSAGLANLSAALNNTTAALAAGTPDAAEIRADILPMITGLQDLQDELADFAVPEEIMVELATISTNLENTSSDLQGDAPNYSLIAADMKEISAGIDAVTAQFAALPAEVTVVPTETAVTPIETQTSETETTTAQPTETASPVVTPSAVQPSSETGDNGFGYAILIIVIIVLIVACVFVVRKKHNKSKRTNNVLEVSLTDKEPYTIKDIIREFPQRPLQKEEPSSVGPIQQDEITKPADDLPVSGETAGQESVEAVQPAEIPEDPTPAGQYKLVAGAIARNHGIMKSDSLTPRDLLKIAEGAPLVQEYISLYEKVRYSRHAVPGDTARLEELAAKILKENT